MTELNRFCCVLRALINSGFPACINRDDYLPDFPVLWASNPPRAFLRLSDEDQAKVWREFIERRPRVASPFELIFKGMGLMP